MSPIFDSELEAQLPDLLARCASADGAALERLYELISPTLFACLLRMLRRPSIAEEVLQDVFVTIWQRAEQFRADRGRPMPWLIAIARYQAIDLLRRERGAPTLVADMPMPVPEPAVPDENILLARPNVALLERCLGLLSMQQRRCVELAFVGGNSHERIAQLTGSPLGTVKSWIRRGLQSLRTCLET